VEFKAVRGLDGVKEAEVDFGTGTKIRVAIAHQMGNIASVLDKIRAAKNAGQEPPYHFVEVMACRGGCVAGGGQPYGAVDVVRRKRADGLYADDAKAKQRCAHQNPFIDKVYKEFLGEPNGHKAHELLHTSYVERELYVK
jgi:NADH-quinone oxidoreductase subunit G